MPKHSSYRNNAIPFRQPDPTLAWVARRCRVTPSVARVVAELANLRNVDDPWKLIGTAANDAFRFVETRR